MSKYNLGFIEDDIIFEHVKSTMLKYCRKIDLKSFNKNIIDPIKMTFDAKVYGLSMKEAISAECMRQIDKTNNNEDRVFSSIHFQLCRKRMGSS